MAINEYAQIDNGVVINIIIANSDEPFDPNYTWILLIDLYCNDGSPIQIGCTYNGSTFSPAA